MLTACGGEALRWAGNARLEGSAEPVRVSEPGCCCMVYPWGIWSNDQ
ncbi:MAG: hypothetical protein F6K28_12290 [Microcoleus sp. SIO2G3]|nr:hypothetical protein [Microcoleus sp. SIO2G3]